MDNPTISVSESTEALNMMTMFGKTAVSLIIVLALIWGLSMLVKRFSRMSPGQGQVLKHVTSTAIGNREKVVVLELNGRWLVLGVASGQVSLLTETDAPDDKPAEKNPLKTTAFSSKLNSLLAGNGSSKQLQSPAGSTDPQGGNP